MKKFWICALLVATGICYVKGQGDYFDDDLYENYDNFEDLEKRIDEEINKLMENTDDKTDSKVKEEIQRLRDTFGEFEDDYQFEDNRDNPTDEKKNAPSDNDGIFESNLEEKINLKETEKNDELENRPEPDDKNAPSRNEDYALLWSDDSIAPLPVPETPEKDENKAIIEETQKILEEEDADNFEEEIKKEIGEVDIKTDDQANMEQIIEETQKILAENDDSFSDNEPKPIEKTADKIDNVDAINNVELKAEDKAVNEADNIKEESKTDMEPEKNVKTEHEVVVEEDTVDKAYADLNADLDKLFATLDKLKENSADDDLENMDKALEEADQFFEDNNNDFDNNNMEGSEELVEDLEDENPIDLDKLLEDILNEDDLKVDTAVEKKFEENMAPIINDALNEPNPEDAAEKDVESLDSKLKPILYLNDALLDETKDTETMEKNDENEENADKPVNASVEKEPEIKTVSVDELTSAELADLVAQFAILHAEDLDLHSKNVAPVHIKLNLDEPTQITSPGYPNPYPTNNIVDWVLEGDGMGIELNITEFAVNGALGDYLLIKPGGMDASGSDGLLFTYRLTNPRRYRFWDVNRLFMRFESKLGMMFFRGFVISAKMIAPGTEDSDSVPEPEPVLAPPHSTWKLTLAVTVRDFLELKEEFRLILADMAEEYIKDNHIDPGLNSTREVTQITNVGLCPVNWPGFEDCSAVTFGVSLAYEDEDGDLKLNSTDLQQMWRTYSVRDPFALRLSRMNLLEFNRPDGSVMTAWMVIAGGVIISMAMLGFVLWRYSCFEDYTRMKTYSDTDSISNEKRTLDLYPTPHQTLPPLYAEHDYKWHDDESTRVDMGGFANRSYARENMYDFESDEEVVVTRDRQGALAKKDASNV